MKKKIAILGLGLLLAVLTVSGGALKGDAIGVCRVAPDRGNCTYPGAGYVCYVPQDGDCNFCCGWCEQKYDAGQVVGVVDVYGCGCCCPPGGGGGDPIP